MAPFFPALSFPKVLAAVVAVALVHTIASYFRDKAEQRRRHEALMRLNFRTGRESNPSQTGDS